MALTPPIKPMLAEARRALPPANALPGGAVAEQKPDGFRAIVFARRDLVMVHSRQGTDLTPAFPDIAQAASAVSEDLVLDGELVVVREGRLDFGALQSRSRRRGRTAAHAAIETPAYLITFDVLEMSGTSLMSLPYRQRRARLESLFAHEVLTAPFTLCPATTDWETARDWLDPAWGSAGIEGVVVKGLDQPYLPDKRAWIKVRAQVTAEAVIGGVTGSLKAPATLLLGRFDASRDLRLVARTTLLSTAVRRELAGLLVPAGAGHPWEGVRFSAGWGTRGDLVSHLVRPDLVAEFIADTAVDSGRFRHPVRFVRLRDDLGVRDVPSFSADRRC